MGAKHNKTKSRIPLFSILEIGNTMAGKTALLESYEYMLNNKIEYDEKNNKPLDLDISTIMMTISTDYKVLESTIKEEQNEDKRIKVKIWDSIGAERFSSTVISTAKNAQGLLFTYDITMRSTFEDLNQWIRQINDYQDISEFPIIIVGCKLDLEDKREVSTEEGQTFAAKYKCPFFETSARTGKGVKEAFSALIQKVYEKNKNKNNLFGLY